MERARKWLSRGSKGSGTDGTNTGVTNIDDAMTEIVGRVKSVRRATGTFTRTCVNEEFFPMHAMPMAQVLCLHRFIPWHEAVARGMVRKLPVDAHVILVSHQWLSFAHPDPDGVQLCHLQRILKQVLVGRAMDVLNPGDWNALAKGTDAKKTASAQMQVDIARFQSDKGLTPETFASEMAESFVWLDYFSIPQQVEHDSGDDLQMQAIQSIPYYVERCSYFMVCAPRALHVDTGQTCDLGTWRERGWCRLEEWANFLSHTMTNPIVVTEHEYVHVMDFADFWSFRANTRFGAVACGNFSCCRLNHTLACGKVIRCDKEVCLSVLEKMCTAKLAHQSRIGNKWAYTVLSVCETKMFSQSLGELFRATWCGPADASVEEVIARIEADRNSGKVDWPTIRVIASLGDERLLHTCAARGVSPAEVNPQHGQTTLHYACQAGSVHALTWMLAHPDIDEAFVNKGSTAFGITALDRAARIGHADVVRLLLEHRADVAPFRTDTGHTPLHGAAEHGHGSAACALVSAGAPVDAADLHGMTPLHTCATGFTLYGEQGGKKDVALHLLLWRADTSLRDHEQRTALEVAVLDDNVPVKELLSRQYYSEVLLV